MKTWERLIQNPTIWEIFFIREEVIKLIRKFFYINKFHELQTPILVSSLIPESYLDVFETYLKVRNGNKIKMYLTTSPEVSIKKLLVAGVGNCFELTKSFRNSETGSSFHNPEFSMLEWYRVGVDYNKIMDDCEKLIIYVTKNLKKLKPDIKNIDVSKNKISVKYGEREINITPPWIKYTIDELLQKYSSFSLTEIIEVDQNGKVHFPQNKILEIAQKKGYKINKNNNWEEIFHQIFLNEVEPHLLKSNKPIIVYEYPSPLAALSKVKKDNPVVAERFEVYIAGLEMADCYTELTDFNEQKKRFEQELQLINRKGQTKVSEDLEFLKAIEYGLPNCSGVALGVDRLVMLLTNSQTIQEVLLFPVKEMFGV